MVLKDEIIDRFMNLISPLPAEIKEIYLFGSRCREDWRPDSDYDLLIVLEKKDRLIIEKLYDAVMDVLLDTGRLISLKIFTVSEFARLMSLKTPFMQNVIKREKRLKNYNRKWKLELIEKSNPEWKDLYEELISGFPDQVGE